jgi:hypothetical protein
MKHSRLALSNEEYVDISSVTEQDSRTNYPEGEYPLTLEGLRSLFLLRVLEHEFEVQISKAMAKCARIKSTLLLLDLLLLDRSNQLKQRHL